MHTYSHCFHATGSRWFTAVLLLLSCLPTAAQPIAVRYPEGTEHGFLALHNTAGKLLAEGDLTQTVAGRLVTLRLVFRFRDGSFDSDTCVFSQEGHFHLLRDHHVQNGPSYPDPSDMTIDVPHGTVTVRYTAKGRQKIDTEQMDLPDDLVNGDVFDVVKNISRDVPQTKLSYIVPTPKPRIVTLSITPQSTNVFRAAGVAYKAERLNIQIELGGLAGLVAPLLGKQPADLNVWVINDEVPAFLRLEGALYLGGPAWTISLVSPELSSGR